MLFDIVLIINIYFVNFATRQPIVRYDFTPSAYRMRTFSEAA